MSTALRDIPLSSYIELRRCAASMPVCGIGVYKRIRIEYSYNYSSYVRACMF